jgi:hypothetical protein
MGETGSGIRRMRGLAAAVGIASIVGGTVIAAPASTAATAPLSIKIVGNHFVNGSGKTIRLLGVDRTSSEYGCVDGFGYDDGHYDNADAAAIASWGANAVRVPLNEDCWLGLNGQPNSDEGADPALTQSGYQHEIKSYVADLNAHGIYAILDLHWTAPGTQVALEQQPMPDFDHSPAFWTSVASTFKSTPAVVFDLFNEPYDPTDKRSGDDENADDKVTWGCWETGTKPDPIGGNAPPIPCYTQAYDDNGQPTTRYRIAGMQTLLNAVRATGAKQPFMTGGLDYADDLGESDGGADWMNNAPDDPLNQEAASFHNYMGKGCDNATCWKNTIAPVAAHVPVVTGEFAEDNFDQAKCSEKKKTTFDQTYMNWADKAGVSYLAWAWLVETKTEQNADACSDFVLIDNYSKHTASKPNGVAVYNHLRSLLPPVTLKAFSAKTRAGNKSVALKLRTTQKSTDTISAKTVHTYQVGKHKKKVAVGAAHLSAKAGKTKSALLKLSTTARNLLVANGSLKVSFTITMKSSKHRPTVKHRTITLKARG